jgi:hypothetical protein
MTPPWTTLKTIDSTASVDRGRYNSLAYDVTGTCYYNTYYDATIGTGTKHLFIAKSSDGSSWTNPVAGSSPVDSSSNDVGMYSSMVIDSSSKIYIIYYDNTTKALKFASSSDGGATW